MKKILLGLLIIGMFVGGSIVIADIPVNHSHSQESDEVLGHSGGTDINGCHHDRKRGGYHCH